MTAINVIQYCTFKRMNLAVHEANSHASTYLFLTKPKNRTLSHMIRGGDGKEQMVMR